MILKLSLRLPSCGWEVDEVCYHILTLCVGIAIGCHDSGAGGLGGVHGVLSVDSQPAPVGTRVRFRHRTDPNTAFFAIVDARGGYAYQPPSQAPLKAGEYEIAIEPVTKIITTDDSGLSISRAIPGAPKSYGKFSNLSKSGLATTLNDGKVEYDIQITSR
ncbi:hypothetical protein [Blastopirellula retiformator]|uniref:Uncharacterized protein n=1 Tax=Blastopirellula retiformator TaxID=2527970 RepID=A0A5C5V4X6_9BACT|nr:hypothetical protein [Blastopirellula retiformator]TWT33381.1 hypothetical protein Enr8_32080 [Blastopirellula retiformator]